MARRILLAGLLMLVGIVAWGCGQGKAKTAEIRVPTAVCGMCADRIETAVSSVDGVQSVTVDLDNKLAQVTYDAGKTNVAAIEDAIVNAGYTANDKPADPAAYENLQDCCKLEPEPDQDPAGA